MLVPSSPWLRFYCFWSPDSRAANFHFHVAFATNTLSRTSLLFCPFFREQFNILIASNVNLARMKKYFGNSKQQCWSFMHICAHFFGYENTNIMWHTDETSNVWVGFLCAWRFSVFSAFFNFVLFSCLAQGDHRGAPPQAVNWKEGRCLLNFFLLQKPGSLTHSNLNK